MTAEQFEAVKAELRKVRTVHEMPSDWWIEIIARNAIAAYERHDITRSHWVMILAGWGVGSIAAWVFRAVFE